MKLIPENGKDIKKLLYQHLAMLVEESAKSDDPWRFTNAIVSLSRLLAPEQFLFRGN